MRTWATVLHLFRLGCGFLLGRGSTRRRGVAIPLRVSHYYDSKDLPRFGEIGENVPELAEKFFDWYGAVLKDGALSAREKSLIALAVAHTLQCPYCIDAYTKDALQKGADLDQMTEALHVAAAMRAGSCLVHGVQMRSRAEKISM